MSTLRLYFLGILESKRVWNLDSLQQPDTFKTPSCNSELVSKNVFGPSFSVAIFSDGNYLSHWTRSTRFSFQGLIM